MWHGYYYGCRRGEGVERCDIERLVWAEYVLSLLDATLTLCNSYIIKLLKMSTTNKICFHYIQIFTITNLLHRVMISEKFNGINYIYIFLNLCQGLESPWWKVYVYYGKLGLNIDFVFFPF